MTGYKQGEVLLANVFASGLGEMKKRPVVVVGNEMVVDIDVLIAPVTSSGARTSFDVEIQHWEAAGLAKPSVARTSKLHAIPLNSIIRSLGQLHDSDLRAVLAKCKELF
ncbi:hypothetical protein PAT3040_02653 [Paenibacillus agaridevorans]|jgi:mRNA interferase MazF|uniref:MazF family transcriptional regulator n=1 Tax=Paenibacillus agaridevorans TaxID=171404 RepID=A0A2R5EN27_9BACL|nr:type II toxin-antitoxin system PemK/MazF family toxin [Paenibacillus agaridevorans]GBG08086.1 hypothetical protein PAT3040_02653 [Paenibacillus agaridevorans]